MSRVKHMTLAQCKRIIDADFVGEHDKKGKQFDYSDYKNEILSQFWALSDRKMVKPTSQYGYQVEIETGAYEVGIQGRHLGDSIEMRLI